MATINDPISQLLPRAASWYSRLRSMTPEERMAALQTSGEIVGGTLGAMAGGPSPLAIPGAGAGAVAGHNIAGWAGRAAGLPMPKRTAKEEAFNQATVLGLNAAGEGIPRGIPVAYRMGKTAVGNALRKALKPDAKHQILVDLADKYNIPLNIAQRSGSTVLQKFQGALERLPFSSSVMRDAYRKQYDQWIGTMGELFNKSDVTPEAFAEIAENSLKTLRGRLNTATNEAVEKAASALHPTPVSKVEAGGAAQEKLTEQFSTVKRWADKAYNGIRAKAKEKNVVVDLTPFAEQADEALQTFPDLPLSTAIFDKGAMGKLSAAKKTVQSGDDMGVLDSLAKTMGADSFSSLNPRMQEAVRAQAAQESVADTTMTLEQAMKTRSRLLNLARGFNRDTPAEKKQAVYALIDGLDSSLEESLGKVPEYADIYKDLKATNATYRSKMEILRKPKTHGKTGNVAAGRIDEARLPEELPTQLAAKPTLAKGTVQALSDSAVADIGTPAGPPALPMLRRSVMDDAVERSTVDQGLGATRISPTKLYGQLKPYGGQLLESPFTNPATPQAVGREGLLYGSKISKAIDDGTSDQVMNAMFPKGAPKRANVSMSLMGDTGQADAARQAFAGSLLDKSKAESIAFGNERFVSPFVLSRQIEDYRGTIPAVLGGDKANLLSSLTDLGRTVASSEKFNPSGTAQALEAMQVAKGVPTKLAEGVGSALKYGAEAIAIPLQAAKRFADPELAKSLTSAPKSVDLSLSRPELGLAGRLLANRNKMPMFPSSPQSEDQWETVEYAPQAQPQASDEWETVEWKPKQ